MKFRAKLELHGKTATGFEVPPEVVEGLGSGKRVPVWVTINGYRYRNTVAPYGGQFFIGVSAEHRMGAGVNAGDELDVELVLDTEPRVIEIPPDLQAALDDEPETKAFFEKLSYSNKSGHVQGLLGAKTDETRQRRLEKSMSLFRQGKS